jgi:DNA ligase (NAD+)
MQEDVEIPLDVIDSYVKLTKTLTEWGKHYANSKPIVSDFVYDEEYKKLKAIELQYPEIIDPNSPSQKVASDSTDGFKKVNHDIPMISIANSNSLIELRNWSSDKDSKGCTEKTMEFKMDGLAMSLRYIDGKLFEAVTRGDGKVGDSVFANILQVPNVPKTIPHTDPIEIRGEVVWLKEDFKKYNEYLESVGKDLMSNPRNGASGTMKSKDPQEVADRKLHFVAYNIVDGSPNDTHAQDLNYLRDVLGFNISEYYVCPNTDKVVSGAEYMEKKRYSLPYHIDGLVIKVNDKSAYKRLGGTAKTPHFCTALKFPPEEKVTKLLYIEHSYGRTGAVTPVAVVEEVELAMTKVNRASLHNWDMVEYLGLHEGCTVVIRKAGEIIPEIVKCPETNRTKDDYEKLLSVDGGLADADHDLMENPAHYDFKWYNRPTTCKHCGSLLRNNTNRSGDELVAWVCTNEACSVKQFRQIVKFVSKTSMNIMGVGESIIESMLSAGLIHDIADLYTVTVDDLLKIDGVKQRSAEKAIDAIKESKNAYLNQLLSGLGIPNLGQTMSAPIADKFKTMDAVIKATVSELESIDGVGHDLAESMVEWFGKNQVLVSKIIANGIALNAKPSRVKNDKLKGLTFIMTGTFDKLGRDDFKDMVIENGGSIASSITKTVNYVLLGESAGPAKVKKIDELKSKGFDIKVIEDSDEFLRMIK